MTNLTTVSITTRALVLTMNLGPVTTVSGAVASVKVSVEKQIQCQCHLYAIFTPYFEEKKMLVALSRNGVIERESHRQTDRQTEGHHDSEKRWVFNWNLKFFMLRLLDATWKINPELTVGLGPAGCAYECE